MNRTLVHCARNTALSETEIARNRIVSRAQRVLTKFQCHRFNDEFEIHPAQISTVLRPPNALTTPDIPEIALPLALPPSRERTRHRNLLA